MRKQLWLLLAAALVVVVLILYPSTQCRVTGNDLTISPVKTFVVPVEQGYAVGVSFNVTNGANCEVNAQKISALLRSVTYVNGTQQTVNLEEGEAIGGALKAGESGAFSYTFNSYFGYRPTKLLLRIEMTFAETGSVLVFDGELPVSA